MTAILVTVLRVVGLVWAIGAVFIMRNARASGDSETARWLFAGGALTFAAGIFLIAASRWAAIPAVLLVLQQGLFHWRFVRTLPADAPRPGPSQVIVALLVASVVLMLVSQGALS